MGKDLAKMPGAINPQVKTNAIPAVVIGLVEIRLVEMRATRAEAAMPQLDEIVSNDYHSN